MSRFIIGIDLGTTNTALAYSDARDLEVFGRSPICPFGISQVVAPGEITERPVLPSFLYLPGEQEFPAGSLDILSRKGLDGFVGAFAREQGARVPGRLIASAKSWLSHPGVDRRSPILPWMADPKVKKLSPLEASTAYLAHLRENWDDRFGDEPGDRLENQEILLTVPASFDAAARELTVEAARSAGLNHVTLLEEPQAAFYAWLASQA